jgi:hypothetical protein
MFRNRKALALCLALCLGLPADRIVGQKSHLTEVGREKNTKSTRDGVLWENPQDIASRNLYYGPGGEKHAPHPGFTYLKEDLAGTSLKFDVRDSDGVKWRVKLGPEARPETVATRLVWAVGYITTEDYFLPDIHVDEMGALKRKPRPGQIAPNGAIHNARLKRMEDEKKAENWAWTDNPFSGSRELNGLRVMMALINNWDLKDENNGVYESKHHKSDAAADSDGESAGDTAGNKRPAQYVVSDLGASFGAPGVAWRFSRSKDNLEAYADSRFITKTTPDYVDFRTPARPAWWDCLANPHDYLMRSRMTWIGHRVPRADAKWIGQLLAQLSLRQIEDAFRAGGYSPVEAEAFSAIVQKRIEALKNL